MNNNKPKILSANEASKIVESSVIKRRKKDARLKTYGRIAIGLAVSFLIFLFVSIFSKGIPGFFQYYVTLDVYLAVSYTHLTLPTTPYV